MHGVVARSTFRECQKDLIVGTLLEVNKMFKKCAQL